MTVNLEVDVLAKYVEQAVRAISAGNGVERDGDQDRDAGRRGPR
jgi:hypothetical protein